MIQNKDISKLPKWAQEHITSLDMEITRLTTHNKDLFGIALESSSNKSSEDSRMVYKPFHNEIPLDSREGVRIWTGEDKKEYRYADIRLERGSNRIIVMASNNLRINPGASNTIYIEVEED